MELIKIDESLSLSFLNAEYPIEGIDIHDLIKISLDVDDEDILINNNSIPKNINNGDRILVTFFVTYNSKQNVSQFTADIVKLKSSFLLVEIYSSLPSCDALLINGDKCYTAIDIS